MKPTWIVPIVAALAMCAAGCTSPQYFRTHSPVHGAHAPELMSESPRELPMFAGHDGTPMNWRDLLDAVAWADIVIVGEQHDDAMGHDVQRALLKDTLERWPRAMLSMEMLERDEQVLVDDYLDNIIETDDFIRLTFSANWGGEGSWIKWFQPIVDVAKDHGAPVIAANAPRRYVRLARTHGYATLDALPRERRVFFDRPRRLPRNQYFERFSDVMSHIEDPDALDAIFRSQMVWDATMARSITRARPSRSAKVVHLVGRFHSDFEGGLIQEIRRHRPLARIVTISMQRLDAFELREADVGRADVIIYTGEPDEPDELDELDDTEEGDEPHAVDEHDDV